MAKSLQEVDAAVQLASRLAQTTSLKGKLGGFLQCGCLTYLFTVSASLSVDGVQLSPSQ